jgi:hypothetical protein
MGCQYTFAIVFRNDPQWILNCEPMQMRSVVSRPLPVALLLISAAVAYANSFNGVFQFDDVTILADARIGDKSTFVSHLGTMIRPALKLTFLADRSLWGANAAGYHLINLLLHAGSGLFLFAIVSRLAEVRTAFWTTLLFLVHPIAVETVTYISGRATGLMAFFYLGAILFHLRGQRFAAIACFAISLLSKETAVTLPLAVLLVDVVARGKTMAELREMFMRAHFPFWAVLALYLFTAALQPRYVYLLDTSLAIRPMTENLVVQLNVVAYALSLFILPWRATIDHDVQAVGSLFAWPSPASFLLIGGLLALAVLLRRRNAIVAFGLLWFFLQLIPTNSVLPRYDLLSERNLYLAAPGLFLAAASLSLSALNRWRVPRAFAVVPIALIVALMSATMARNALYADPITFWTDAARKAPGKARPHVNLGHAYFEAEDFDRAIVEFRTALRLDPHDPVAQANLRAAYRRRGDVASKQ